MKTKESLLIRGGISLKVICEKGNFQTVIFAIILTLMNRHICKLFTMRRLFTIKSLFCDITNFIL